jgi:hypothetical protein
MISRSKATIDDIMARIITMDLDSKAEAAERKKVITDMTEKLDHIQHDQQLIIAANSKIQAELQSLKTDHGDLSSEFQSVKKETKTVSKTVDRLAQQVNQLRQEKIQQQIVISGFPANFDDKKSTDKIVLLAQNLGVTIRKNDIIKAYKINTKQSHKHIIKLATMKMKTDLLQARKGKSIFTDEIGIPGQRQQVFLQEDLTFENQSIYHYARKALKPCGFTHIWTEDGKIRARDQANKKHTVASIAAVDQLAKNYRKETDGDAEEDFEDAEGDLNEGGGDNGR